MTGKFDLGFFFVRTEYVQIFLEVLGMTGEKSARINMRISEDALERLRLAAKLRQQDLTSFVLGSAIEKSSELLLKERLTSLNKKEIAKLNALIETTEKPRPVKEVVRQEQDQRKKMAAAWWQRVTKRRVG
jgi:uncharacterized protein (DUF1778 family)